MSLLQPLTNVDVESISNLPTLVVIWSMVHFAPVTEPVKVSPTSIGVVPVILSLPVRELKLLTTRFVDQTTRLSLRYRDSPASNTEGSLFTLNSARSAALTTLAKRLGVVTAIPVLVVTKLLRS